MLFRSGITDSSTLPCASANIHLIVVLATLVVGVYNTFSRGAISVLRVIVASEVSDGNEGIASSDVEHSIVDRCSTSYSAHHGLAYLAPAVSGTGLLSCCLRDAK